mmetsp:Transcript_328/g.694  ORF Transcript_328/g.694 Transcript_328/m.694 type:complete len:207 (-) Transcript_328:479-1099(-)
MGGRISVLSCCCREDNPEAVSKPKGGLSIESDAVEIKLDGDTDRVDGNEVKELRNVINDLYLQNKLQKEFYKKKLRNSGSMEYINLNKGVSFSSRVKVHIIDPEGGDQPEDSHSLASPSTVRIGPIDGAAEYVVGMFKRVQDRPPIRGDYGALSTHEDDAGDVSDNSDYCAVEVELSETHHPIPRPEMRRPEPVASSGLAVVPVRC